MPSGTRSLLRESQLLHESQTGRIARESERAATLALHVVDQSTQRNVLPLAPWAMIDSLLVCRTSEMLIQAG